MALSMRQEAARCLGVTGVISMRHDVFGYVYGPPNRPYRLRTQLDRARGTAFNLSVILVGFRDDFSGATSRADVRRITSAIQRTREIYAQVELGIRTVYWSSIADELARGYDTIADAAEARRLTEEWSADNDGVDVFFVRSIAVADGCTVRSGPCDKEAKGFSGVVVELLDSDETTGIVLAHELGHYLGLDGGTDRANVMGDDADKDGIDEISVRSFHLTGEQGAIIRRHPVMRAPCGQALGVRGESSEP
jgi:hypothetical protein